ncbi:MAG: LTA synthase family protein [Bacteroidales bacterium]|nr:LTA synthase family protein [Bacteroidales bacterium]
MVKDFFRSRTGVLWLGMFASLLYFVIVWSLGSTFRGMSNWVLYPINLMVAGVLTLPYMLSRRVWVQIVVMVAVQLLLIANLMYYRTYFTAIPLGSYALVGNVAEFTASIRDSLRALDFGFPLITILTAWRALQAPAKPCGARTWAVLGVGTGVCALAASVDVACKGGFMTVVGRISQSTFSSPTVVPVYTVAGNLIYQSMLKPTVLTDEMAAQVADWRRGKDKIMPYAALPDSVERRHSLVIVLCESLESWVIDAEIGGQAITPYLNSLVADSTTFYAPYVVTQVGAGRSIEAQLLIFAGLLPMQNSIYSMNHADSAYPTLNKAMRQRYGTESYLLSVDKQSTWNQVGVSRAFAYDSLLEYSAWSHHELIGRPPRPSDRSFFSQSADKLANSGLWPIGESRLITMVTYSGHNPFVLPDKFRDPSFDGVLADCPPRMADYVRMAHYTDSALPEIIEYLKSRPDYKDMIVLITGDHEGLASDRSTILRSPAGSAIVSPGQYTPLIILNSPIPGRYDEVLGQVDIYPTLLNLLGLDDYPWKGQGNSVFSPHKPPFAIVTMTGEIVGDTTALAPEVLPLVRAARQASDTMITFDLLQDEE